MWPEWLVFIISSLKAFFAFFRDHSLYGIPLDWVVRFIVLSTVYWCCRTRSTLKTTLFLCFLILISKELFDTFAVRAWKRIHWPEILDLEDIASGLVGMLSAEVVHRLSRGRTASPMKIPASADKGEPSS